MCNEGWQPVDREARILSKRLLVATLLAVACSDSVSPERPSLRAPVTADAAAEAAPGIALAGFNGTLPPQSGTTLGKEFQPANPPLGSTVIATFVWLGSTNIITSVTDVLWTGQQVGNTYQLVEYVTAGGYSMATYVATNVQNFPDPNDPSTGVVLAVRANLSDSVADGGLLISLWSGVDGVSTQALGAHHSGFGSGTSTTVADAGTIPVGAGALVYGVTMSDGLFGRFAPQGFTNISTQSDASMVSEGDYAVQSSASTVDPQWTWFFDSPSSPRTWLATALALNPPPSPATGNLTVSTSTTGANLDPNGYTITVDGGSPQAIGINASVSYLNLTAGNHTVAISGVAANCTVSGGTSRTVSVPSGGTATTTFSVSCNAPPVVNAGPDQTAVTGLLYSFSPSFTDANNDGPWSYRIAWGDGSVSTGTRTSQGSWSVGHTYVIILPRSFTVRVTVTDSHGASGSDTKVVSVLLL